jgi:hypothetical protein
MSFNGKGDPTPGELEQPSYISWLLPSINIIISLQAKYESYALGGVRVSSSKLRTYISASSFACPIFFHPVQQPVTNVTNAAAN